MDEARGWGRDQVVDEAVNERTTALFHPTDVGLHVLTETLLTAAVGWRVSARADTLTSAVTARGRAG